MLIPSEQTVGATPEFGPVHISKIETVIQNFQFRIHAQQPITLGGYHYSRNTSFYAFEEQETDCLPYTGMLLEVGHIRKVESNSPQYQGHQIARSGKYLSYGFCRDYQPDIVLATEEQLRQYFNLPDCPEPIFLRDFWKK